MFFVALENGKYRYYEKFYDTNCDKWRQVSCTLKSKTRQAQGEARRILEGMIEKKLEVKKSVVTFGTLYESWLAFRKVSVKDSTFYTQLIVVKDFSQKFYEKNINEITSIEIQNYILSLDKKIGTLRVTLSVLNMIFAYGKRLDMLSDNPVSNVKLPRQLRTVEELHKKNMKFYSKEEAKELFKYFNTVKRNKICALLAEFLYLTGLRFGEASGLQKEDIDFENMCLTVNHTLSRLNITNQFKLSSPKTASAYRTVYFNDRCKEILLEAFKHNKSEKYQSFVFVNSVQSLFDNGNFNVYLAKYALRSGIRPDLKPTSHVFRHSHVSLLVEMGLPLKVIMQRVGHTDEKMTTQIYTHITSAMNNNYVEVIRGFDLTKI